LHNNSTQFSSNPDLFPGPVAHCPNLLPSCPKLLKVSCRLGMLVAFCYSPGIFMGCPSPFWALLDYFCPLPKVALISCSLLEAAQKYALLVDAAWTSPADWGLPGLLLGLPDNSSCCLVVLLAALCSVQSTRWLLAVGAYVEVPI
jgi:hypothetical protein